MSRKVSGLKKNIEIKDYVFVDYTMLSDTEQEIALNFRNQNKEWMINKEIIELEEHKKWIKSLNNNDSILYYLVFKKDLPFMVIYYHDIDYVKKESYWGYFLGDKRFKAEVLKVEKTIIDIAFNRLSFNKLLCINNIKNPVIGIHKFFGFKEGEVISIDGQDFLKMSLVRG
jgi:UDP-4-amino-4,6-dideoxy-N-acetyl-beta-L-altrosamine N-acetyltransferase